MWSVNWLASVMIFGTFGYMDPMLKVSKEFPGWEVHTNGYKPPKQGDGNIRFYEGRYVQGIVAGMMTKTNKIDIVPFLILEASSPNCSPSACVRPTHAEIMVDWANTRDPVKEADAAMFW